MYDYVARRSILKMANGNAPEVQGRSLVHLQSVPNEGKPVKFTVHDSLYMHDLAYRLFSLRVATKDGHSKNGVDDNVDLYLKQEGQIRF